jgi:prepilin-type N-terminal cleavage/methylation domain-containing protein
MTLLEIMIVILLLGILAAITYPIIRTSVEEGEQQAFYSSLATLARASEYYHHKTGQYPQTAVPGTEPPGLNEYVAVISWSNETPVGGKWVARQNLGGIKAAVGVEFGDGEEMDLEQLIAIDSRFDDGNLSGGKVRQVAQGFYFILDE